MRKKPVIVIAGPTASGKTSLAIELAHRLESEVISADSRIVYKEFNIGTAKPTKQEMAGIPHHMIDIVEPTENYTVAQYAEDVQKIITSLHENDKIPIIAGGTGFYIRAGLGELEFANVEPDQEYRNALNALADKEGNDVLYKQLKLVDPARALKIHVNDRYRIIRALEFHKQTGQRLSDVQEKKESPYNVIYTALNAENRSYLHHRMNLRVLDMLETGLVDEVKFLLQKYGKPLSLMNTLGYKEVIEFLENKCSYTQMVEQIQAHTRQFAKRQLIWFRADKRIHWHTIDSEKTNSIINDIIRRI